MIAPPTPERLEQDKKSVEEQFDKAFVLVEQLARDTEALKAAEKDRTERLDAALEEMESVLKELKMSNRRLDDDAQRIRQDVQNLQDSIPKAVDAQKQATDQRLKELNKELVGLKTLLSSVSHPGATGAGSSAYTNGTSANQEKIATGEGESSAVMSPSSDAARPPTPSYQSGGSSATRSIPSWQRSLAMKNSEVSGGSSSN
jgi:peroxin-14